ncbi:MAG: phage tail assembly protein [Desulfarculus sp.]|nr:phage tail assembly protein [Desulfarculus sp.]
MNEHMDQGGPFAPETREITLKRPITVGGQPTSTITLHEPTLAQAEFLDKVRFKFDQEGNGEILGMGTTCKLALIHLGGLTENETRQIKGGDIMAIWTAVMGFLTGSPGTGARQ